MLSVEQVIGLRVIEVDGGYHATEEVRLLIIFSRNVDHFERLELLLAKCHSSQLAVRIDFCGDELQRTVVGLENKSATKQEMLPFDEGPENGRSLLFDRRVPHLSVGELFAGVLDDAAMAIDFL